MGKKKRNKDSKEKLVKSVNKNVRSSVRKLNPIFFRIIAKKVIVDFASFIKLKFSKRSTKVKLSGLLKNLKESLFTSRAVK